jgi:sporulation protein YqfC
MRRNREFLKGQQAKFKSAFVNILEIPADIALNLPRITMLGNLQLNIENHKGIMEYTDHRIKIMVSRGYLEIEGKNLVLRNVQIDEILINGEINQIKITITG